MAKFKVKVEGLREIEKALSELPKATGKNVLRRFLKDRAKPIMEDAKSLAPVDTGGLKEGISMGTKISRRVKMKLPKSTVWLAVGAAAKNRNAWPQEIGTENNPAHPFMRPAWDANKETSLDGLKDDLWAEIDKASKRLSKKRAKLGL